MAATTTIYAREALAEHCMVRLLRAVPASGLAAGAVGTVVHIYEGAADYEVEFPTDGKPLLVTLSRDELEALSGS